MAIRNAVQLRPRMEKANPKYKEQRKEVSVAEVAAKMKTRLAGMKRVSVEELFQKINQLPPVEVPQNVQEYINQNSELAKIQPKTQTTTRLLQSLLETTQQIQSFKPTVKKTGPPRWSKMEPLLGKKFLKAHKEMYDKVIAKVPIWAKARPAPMKAQKTNLFDKLVQVAHHVEELRSHNEITEQIIAKTKDDITRLEALTIDEVLDSNPHLVQEIEDRLATNNFDPFVKESADDHAHAHH